jgi:hypothetical protein
LYSPRIYEGCVLGGCQFDEDVVDADRTKANNNIMIVHRPIFLSIFANPTANKRNAKIERTTAIDSKDIIDLYN